MRIAFIGQKGVPAISGGVEKYVEDLASRAALAGHEVLVYTRPHYTPVNAKSYRGMQLISLPSVNTKHLDAISHTALACIDVVFRQVDVIHFQAIGPALLIWLPKIFCPRAKIVATLQSRDYEHQKWGVLARLSLRLGEWLMCRLADEVIVVTKSMQAYVRERYQLEADYIANGANLNLPNSPADLIRAWGLTKDSYAVAISRLVRHKGLSRLIDAWKLIKTDKKLVIVGGSAFTDDYVEELYALAATDERILFLGEQSGQVLAELYDNACLFVQPSESEGLSLSLLEAMARGKAVLVSSIAENKDAVGEAGFVFPVDDTMELKNKLQNLLQQPDLLARAGELARARAGQYYNWDELAPKIMALYAEPKAVRAPIKVLKKSWQNFLSLF